MFSRISPSLFIIIGFYLQNQVLSSPVLLWSNANLSQSAVPHSEISSINLISDYICKLPNKQIELRIFAVNDLTIEDIQYGPQRNHPLLLDAKKDKTNFRFYPNVADDIHKAFSLIPQSNNMKCSQTHFEIKSSKIYETFHDALNIMQATIDTDPNDIVIIALVNSPSDSQTLSRRRRQTNQQEPEVLISKDQTCMFHVEQLRWNDANGTKSSGRNYTLDYDTSTCQSNTTTPDGNSTSVILNLVWTNDNAPYDNASMSIITTRIGRYWYLEKATINNNEYRYFAYGMPDKMDTPPTYSYVCNSAIFVRYNNSVPHGQYNFTDKFYLIGLQFQPFLGNGLAFGPPNYCTSFFTSGIWMGITSSLLCLGILLFGIHRLMSIKSNDRFDDPKGKPLVIKAQE
jgi:hypothetical protein